MMLKILSYLNIALALSYFLVYLLNSYSWPIVAILLVIFYNGLVLKSLERETGFSLVHYVLGGFSIFFAGFLVLWVVNIVSSAIENQYFDGVWTYSVLTGVFALSIISQFILTVLSDRS